MNFKINVKEFGNVLLEHLLRINKNERKVKFWLRRRNTNERLDNGFWFNGTDKYIHIGVTKLGSGNLSTQSIGFVILDIDSNNVRCGIEILFKGEKRNNLIKCYHRIIEEVGGFEMIKDNQYFKAYSGDIWINLDDFFLVQYPKIIKVINECGLSDELEIEDEDFKKSLHKILQKQNELASKDKPKFLIANITWNSKDWKEISEDASGHAWVGGDNIPHESWNFDLDNARNPADKLFGFAKFTHPPKVEGSNNLIIFYSDKKIVGFYGKAEILKDWVSINEQESYNLIGEKDLVVVLENKIENLKEKGYLEDKERIGQIGFSYLENINTVKNILDEAIKLNPNQSKELNKIKDWIINDKQFKKSNTYFDMIEPELNQIFFGPPGTGKTYNTINEAIKIADPEFYKVNYNDREALTQRFKLLLLNNDNENIGQIGFATFHQSMSYEDFIEGIKPVTPEPNDIFLKYKIQDGIFKRICRIANDSLNAVEVNSDNLLSLTSEDFDKAHFYKMSLGNSQSDLDNEIYEYCIENNCIALGWGDGYDYTGKDEISIKEFGNSKRIDRFSITAINQFKILLKIGDYVIISNGNYYVRAIGKVVGDYEFKALSPFANNPLYNQFRKVEWIFKDKSIPVTEIYNKNLSQQTIYQLIKSEIKKDFFVKDKKVDFVKLPKNPKNYVLIIDEINRGNVSSIFGELITLIEKDKRAGTNEELSVILPYSKKEFKVPHNVYIIGTMNTADRSIEALDTALRRRFSFKEMPPKPNLIATEGKLSDKNGKLGSIDLVAILTVINNRIEKLIDKDHKIGHSFFLGIKTEQDLKNAFKDKVIPLLEEYFYGDFGKISLVLGSSFISKSANTDVSFARNNDYDPSISADLLERSVYEVTHSDNWDFEAIYQ